MKFEPVKPKMKKREVLGLHLTPELSEALETAVKKSGLTKQDLVRQMITHCVQDMGIKVEKDGQE